LVDTGSNVFIYAFVGMGERAKTDNTDLVERIVSSMNIGPIKEVSEGN